MNTVSKPYHGLLIRVTTAFQRLTWPARVSRFFLVHTLAPGIGLLRNHDSGATRNAFRMARCRARKNGRCKGESR
ncbi:hypothetical protein [Paraburkholderia sp. JHI869]|uniref:hypothetical protein n=1 Tax=Paraburkholderia sp. JHI869 TaxID=3112959 RepID=UPI0031801AD4